MHKLVRKLPESEDDSYPFQPSFENMELPEPLTKKEAEVLALMTAGLSNKEIAKSMGVTEATIKTHARFSQGWE